MWLRFMGLRLAAAVLLLPAVGCAGAIACQTEEQLALARQEVEAARQAEAKNLAPDPLAHARDALAIAQDAYANQSHDRASEFSRKAILYARVAKARAEQKTAERKLQEARSRLDHLSQQSRLFPKQSITPAGSISAANQGNTLAGDAGFAQEAKP